MNYDVFVDDISTIRVDWEKQQVINTITPSLLYYSQRR